MHNILFSHKICRIMVLDEKGLDEILEYLEKSIANLASDAFGNLELGETQRVEDFLQNQYDIRLENLLSAKDSSIHHLESGMKNKIIQRKRSVLEDIGKQYKN